MYSYRFGKPDDWLKANLSYNDLLDAITSSSNTQDRFLYIYDADTLLWVGDVEQAFKKLYADSMSDYHIQYWANSIRTHNSIHTHNEPTWTWRYKYYWLLDEAKGRSLSYIFEVLKARMYRGIHDYTGVPDDRLPVLARGGETT